MGRWPPSLARDAVRRLKSEGPISEPVRVIVADGTYRLAEAVVFTAEDSGTEKCPITYEAALGAKPIFTAGRIITGFKEDKDGVWRTHIPEVAAGKWYFEQLFVNGRRAVRARTPNKFHHYMGKTSEVPVEGTPEKFRRTTYVRPAWMLWSRCETFSRAKSATSRWWSTISGALPGVF